MLFIYNYFKDKDTWAAPIVGFVCSRHVKNTVKRAFMAVSIRLTFRSHPIGSILCFKNPPCKADFDYKKENTFTGTVESFNWFYRCCWALLC